MIDRISQIGNFMTKILQSFDGSCCLGFSTFFQGRVKHYYILLLHIYVNWPQANSNPSASPSPVLGLHMCALYPARVFKDKERKTCKSSLNGIEFRG